MTSPARSSTLSARVRAFLDAPRFASIATIDRDGTPHQSVVWYLLEGDTLVINSKVGRRWPTNLLRDPRLALSIVDVEDGYRWLGLNGTVEVVDDPEQAQDDIAAMARQYHADDPQHAEDLIARTFRPARRISFRITPREVHDHLD